MHKLLRSFALLCLALLCNACVQLVQVKPHYVTPDEALTKPVLKQFLAAHPNPSVVLRVPVAYQQVTQTVQADVDARNAAYGVIEREFVRAGFTVRDRALLTALLGEGKTYTYSEIKDRIQTDLIIDVTRFETSDMKTQDYTVTDKHTGNITNKNLAPYGVWFGINGITIEARVIIVENGEIGGIYTVTVPPCNPCDFFVDMNGPPWTYPTESMKNGTGPYQSVALTIDYKMAAQRFADYLINQIRPGGVPPSSSAPLLH